MNLRRISAPIAMTAMLLSACDARYRDVSSEPAQKTLIGKVCNAEVDLRAHGVARKLERDKKTDYVSIWNPGFTGPEMTFLVILPPGTKLEVVAARECMNCSFDRGLEYRVKVNPEPAQFEGRPAYIRSASMAMPYVKCPGDAAKTMIPAHAFLLSSMATLGYPRPHAHHPFPAGAPWPST